MHKAVEITSKKVQTKDTPSPSYRANCIRTVTDGHLKISNQHPDYPGKSQQVHVRQLNCSERRENYKSLSV